MVFPFDYFVLSVACLANYTYRIIVFEVEVLFYGAWFIKLKVIFDVERVIGSFVGTLSLTDLVLNLLIMQNIIGKKGLKSVQESFVV